MPHYNKNPEELSFFSECARKVPRAKFIMSTAKTVSEGQQTKAMWESNSNRLILPPDPTAALHAVGRAA